MTTKTQPEEKLAADKKPGLEHPEYKELQDKLNEAEEKVNEYWNEILRGKADLENQRKRAERDLANAHKYGLDKFAKELLPVIDSMERGLETCNHDDELSKKICHGMQLTIDMMLKACEKVGLQQIDPIGQEFDPEHHEAMTMQEDKKAKPNTVLMVMQKGYLLNDRLLRPALVVVAKS